ncbi:MAG: hypothetical protein IKU71_00450 [Kiritimatiellae bacterium]|nr:hypothetical protein [Kiritimatiellia bacterium]
MKTIKSRANHAPCAHPSGKRRTILGHHKDVRTTADYLPHPSSPRGIPCRPADNATDDKLLERLKRKLVKRVWRHFGKRSRTMGKRYACIARAMLSGRQTWKRKGIPERTFRDARKKIQDFFQPLLKRPKPLS